jgi:beta-fructofuranosidase
MRCTRTSEVIIFNKELFDTEGKGLSRFDQSDENMREVVSEFHMADRVPGSKLRFCSSKEDICMLTHYGNQIGDSWFYVKGDITHCYYLTSPEHVKRHTYWDIGHAVSRNLVDWEILGIALQMSPRGKWDESLATGSVIRWQGQYWMAYTSHATAQTGVAVSDDLEHWQRISDYPKTSLDPRYYEETGSGKRKLKNWRDPFLFEYSGQVYQLVCASLNRGAADARGTVGVARTRDMENWEVLPPLEVELVAQELECPQIYAAAGRYYLLFSTGTDLFSADFLSRHNSAELGYAAYSMIGPSPLGPFHITGNGRVLPPDYSIQPYAAQIVWHEKKAYLLGTIFYQGTHRICDPVPVEFTPEGIKLAT